MRILSKYDLFIFDWDHTLTSSTFLVTLLYVLGRKHGRRRSEELRHARLPRGLPANIELKEDVSKLYSRFDDLYGVLFKPELKPGALQTLELLKDHGKKVVIFSDSKAYRLMKETRELDVLRHVDFWIAAESIGYYKPHPMGLLFIRNRFRVPARRCLYIGDLASDVLTARLAGMDSAAVADGIDSYQELRDAKPDYLLTNMAAFLKSLREGW